MRSSSMLTKGSTVARMFFVRDKSEAAQLGQYLLVTRHSESRPLSRRAAAGMEIRTDKSAVR